MILEPKINEFGRVESLMSYELCKMIISLEEDTGMWSLV